MVGVKLINRSFQLSEILLFWRLVNNALLATKGPITWRTFNPGVELEFFCDYKDDFNPGVETLYYTFLASIPGSKKAFILFSCNK